MGYSLKQKVFMSKRDGKREVVLTMEEAEQALEALTQYDQRLSRLWDLLSDEARDIITQEMFG